MALIDVERVSKAFSIPSVRRETVREHLFGLLKPRRFQRLQVLDLSQLETSRQQMRLPIRS